MSDQPGNIRAEVDVVMAQSLEPQGPRTGLPGAERVRAATDQLITGMLDHEAPRLRQVGLTEHVQTLREFLLSGGKRMRALFCYWGWLGAGGSDDLDALYAAAAALEVNHSAFLIHDDIIDRSRLRRGQMAVHHRFASQHAGRGWHGASVGFGDSVAITLGDLCFDWARRLLTSHTPGNRLAAVTSVYDRMQSDTCYGQMLEVQIQADRDYRIDRCQAVVVHKAARYMVTPPLLIGAALAGADQATCSAYEAFGDALGEAYQLRDDLLGVFGEPQTTGKPNLDDLREGKPTVLFATALHKATAAQYDRMLALYGQEGLDQTGADELRALLKDTDAADTVKEMIQHHSRRATSALAQAPIRSEGRRALETLARHALFRDR
jgi:geranylgeranyl diphosphate synthase, type I